MKRYSIVQDDLSKCLICDTTQNIHIHHVFGGTANRSRSEEYHCIVALCHFHHTGRDGIHFNKEMDEKLKKFAQEKFEEVHGDRESFMKIFGRNYL